MDPLRWSPYDNLPPAPAIKPTDLEYVGETCVHCYLLPKGIRHDHTVWGLCERGKPQTAWFNYFLLTEVLHRPVHFGARMLDDWRVVSQTEDEGGGLFIHLDSSPVGVDRNYIWRVEPDITQRVGFVKAYWVD